MWDNVVDFKWHRSTPSPNWSAVQGQEIASYAVIDSSWVISSGLRTLIGLPDWADKSGMRSIVHNHQTVQSSVLPEVPPVTAATAECVAGDDEDEI